MKESVHGEQGLTTRSGYADAYLFFGGGKVPDRQVASHSNL